MVLVQLSYIHSGTKFVSNKPFEATSFTGDVTGNADTANTLQTARTIAGVSFDGSANISLNNNAITNGAGISQVLELLLSRKGLTGTPNINVGVITATSFSGDGSASFGGDINVGGYDRRCSLGASGAVFSHSSCS